MKQFLALLRLELSQWRASLSMGGRNQKKDRKLSRTAVILLMIVIAAVYLVFFELKALDLLQVLGTPKLLLKILVFLSMFMTLMTGLMQAVSTFYFSKDVPILSYLPASSAKMYAARLCAMLLGEIAICALFVLPGTVLYLIRITFDGGLLLRALLVTCLAPVLPVCIVTMLAGIITRIPGFWKHRELIMTVITVLLLLLWIAFSFFMGSFSGSSAAGGEDMTQLIQTLTRVTNGTVTRFAPIRWCADGLADGGLNLLWALLASCGGLVLVWAVWGPSYLATASRSAETETEGKKIDLKKTELRVSSPLKALVLREIREMLRTPAYFVNGLLISLIMPTMMLGLILLSFTMNVPGGITALLSQVDPTGNYKIVIAAVLTALMGLMLGMNSSAATAVSREGSRHSLFRSLPVSTWTILKSKLIMALFFHWIGLVPACVLAAVLIPGFVGHALLMLLWGMMLAFIGTVLGIILDVKKPRLDWINETQAIKSGFIQLISLLIYFVLLLLLGAGSFLLVSVGISMPAYTAILTGALLLLCLLFGLWLRRQTRAYEAIGV